MYCSTMPAGKRATGQHTQVAAAVQKTARSVDSHSLHPLTQQQQLWAACEDTRDLLKRECQPHGCHAEHQAPGDVCVIEPQEQRGVMEAHNSGKHHPPEKGRTAA